ncbi:hypothetical protein PspLS_06933 [Pyricularia sp. CBS 133598]|nr:hypothetical protein PspLS_06933 [Pyricularia sp. CBS 133598]
MEYITRYRRSSWGHLEEPKEISTSVQHDDKYQARGRKAIAMAFSAQKQSEPRRAPSILKRQNSSRDKRHSVRFVDQERESVSTTDDDVDTKWFWLPQEGDYALKVPVYKWKPET